MMMLSKHGLRKFHDGSVIIHDDENEITNNIKEETKALFCEHFTDATCTHSILRKSQKCMVSLCNVC